MGSEYLISGSDLTDGAPPFATLQNANHNYRDQVLRMLRLEEVRLIVNLDDLRDYNRDYADGYVHLVCYRSC